ncbi:DUF2304 domain-containing protein [Cognatilysobacter segetis]|uniref:DUF2304 domain-containing protein n=1 Tax=Cognatilysobacter segetis TaxID=2492394 RepID=UPI00139018C1|nr:DUF2304 domain-containing protein [Lysobacter segetis]
MIRYLLSAFGLLVIAYGLREWRRSKLVGLSLIGISLAGMFLVWFPAVADRIAGMSGVTRGADLVLYCYSATSFVMLLNLALKQRELHQSITDLARHISMSTVRMPKDREEVPTARPTEGGGLGD